LNLIGSPRRLAGVYIRLHATLRCLSREGAAEGKVHSVSSILVQLVGNRDRSQTYALVVMHEMTLYIVEATVPKGAPSPVMFAGSFSLIAKGTDHPPRI
jgi:hypothetical protein